MGSPLCDLSHGWCMLQHVSANWQARPGHLVRVSSADLYQLRCGIHIQLASSWPGLRGSQISDSDKGPTIRQTTRAWLVELARLDGLPHIPSMLCAMSKR
jgi:hypothetical protein